MLFLTTCFLLTDHHRWRGRRRCSDEPRVVESGAEEKSARRGIWRRSHSPVQEGQSLRVYSRGNNHVQNTCCCFDFDHVQNTCCYFVSNHVFHVFRINRSTCWTTSTKSSSIRRRLRITLKRRKRYKFNLYLWPARAEFGHKWWSIWSQKHQIW